MDDASDTNVMISRGRVWQSNRQRCGIRISSLEYLCAYQLD